MINKYLDSGNSMSDEGMHGAPAITLVSAADIDLNDPLFDDLKADYVEFADWWKEKVVAKGRKGWTSRFEDGSLSCVLMYKVESGEPMTGLIDSPIKRRLKISTLKVADVGHKLGELLIWESIRYAWSQQVEEIYVTHFTKQNDYLSHLLDEFGFHIYDVNERGEDVYVKSFASTRAEWSGKSPINIAIDYAPQFVDCPSISKYVVPVQSEYHERLFTDLERTPKLSEFEGAHLSEGNAVKKAYICRSPARSMKQGDILLFYRSRDRQGAQPIGIVEEVHYDQNDPQKIYSLIRKRTVYSLQEIEEMVMDGSVTVILFRYQAHISSRLDPSILISNGVIKAAPQAIVKLEEGQYSKIKEVGELDRRLTLD
jgi:hypothetical protein